MMRTPEATVRKEKKKTPNKTNEIQDLHKMVLEEEQKKLKMEQDNLILNKEKTGTSNSNPGAYQLR